MLKARFQYLMEKKGINRKQLADGLLTLPHLSNLLAERYLLADDLAGEFGKRLDVAAEYLLQTSDSSHQILQTANQYINQVITGDYLPREGKANALVLELTIQLANACYYQSQNDQAGYQKLHEDYLNFYIRYFEDSRIESLPVPLQKAFYYYKVQTYRSLHQFEEADKYVMKILSLLQEDELEIWLTLQKIEMEVLLHIKAYDRLKKVFQTTEQRVMQENVLHHLAGLYLLYSGFTFQIGLTAEAFYYLAKAESNLTYLSSGKEDYLMMIYNNRIVMHIRIQQYKKALEEVERLREWLEQNSDTPAPLYALLAIYRCDLFLLQQDFAALAKEVKQLEEMEKNEDQVQALSFYESQLLFEQKKIEEVLPLLLKVTEYFEKQFQKERLLVLYEQMGICYEELRQYKKAAEMYKKTIQLLK